MNKKVILQLDALSCPSCLTKIETALKKTPGVGTTKVLFNAGKVKAEIDDSQTSGEALSDIVTKLGYEVQKMKVKDLA